MVKVDSAADPSRSWASSKAARTGYWPGGCSNGKVTVALPLASVTAWSRCGPNLKTSGRPLTVDPFDVSTAVNVAASRYVPLLGATLKLTLVDCFGAVACTASTRGTK